MNQQKGQWKMVKNLSVILICSILIVVVSAYSKEEPPDETEAITDPLEKVVKKEEADEEGVEMDAEMQDPYANLLERAPQEPTTIEEIVRYPVGPLAGKSHRDDLDEMVEFVTEVLPPIEDEADEEYLDTWWRAYRYLFAESYPDPNQIVTKMNLDFFGHDGIEDPRYQFKEQINVLVILDVSGSMANTINGQTMMDIAKDAIHDFISTLPKEANVGLRVYGHEGQRTGATKEQSCQSTELVYDIQPLDQSRFHELLATFEPTGWTPIARSLEEVKEDFATFSGKNNTNLVYVVSDGVETCGGDPVAAAQALADSNIQPIINVIGFNVDMDGQRHLREIAEAGQGLYTNAGNEEQLKEAFDQAEEILRQWRLWKQGARRDAIYHRNDQNFATHMFDSEWIRTNMREDLNISFVSTELRSNGYITRSADNYFREKRREQDSLYSFALPRVFFFASTGITIIATTNKIMSA